MNDETIVFNDAPSDCKSSFDFFWENVICKTIDRAYEEIDDEYKRACNVCKKDAKQYKVSLEEIYHKKRNWLKKMYLPHDEEPILDFHKLGAVLCRDIIYHKPFSFNVQEAERFVENKFDINDTTNHTEWFVRNVYANYKVAFYVSTGIVFLEILKHYDDKGDMETYDKFNARGRLFFYPKSTNHENFENSCILGLMKNDLLKRNFDYLTYSAMLFQLEQYNYIQIEKEFLHN